MKVGGMLVSFFGSHFEKLPFWSHNLLSYLNICREKVWFTHTTCIHRCHIPYFNQPFQTNHHQPTLGGYPIPQGGDRSWAGGGPSPGVAGIDGWNPANQLIGSLSLFLRVCLHPRWCRSSSINSIGRSYLYIYVYLYIYLLLSVYYTVPP